MLKYEERTPDGLVADGIDLYGMEAFPLDHLTVVSGELSPLYDPGQNAIAAVYFMDDYNNPEEDSRWAEVGDQVTLRYVDKWEYYNPQTGEIYGEEAPEESNYAIRAAEYHEVAYTVAACVAMKNPMSFRYYGSDQFILNSEVFKRDTGCSDVMTYIFDTTKESNAAMESFLKDYTENIDPTMDYESRESYTEEFAGFRNMFLMMGGVLSAVIGFVGVLNYLNAILTSIMTRKREFAMLQSIGMTGRQLKTMLVCEGVFYVVLTLLLSLVLTLFTGILLDNALSGVIWFFTYRFTLLPILLVLPVFLLLGVILPLMAYRFTARLTIVERLRVAE